MTARRRTASEIESDDHKKVGAWKSNSTPEQVDTIKRGDRVSWSLGDGFPRAFGRVVRLCTQDYQRAFSVREDTSGMGRIIPARFITKECG